MLMKTMITAAGLVGTLGAATPAMADWYAPVPPPVYNTPAPPVYGYGYGYDRGYWYGDRDRDDAWRRHEWREHEWREHEGRRWRHWEHERREHGWGW